MYHLTCDACGDPFTAQVPHARYCTKIACKKEGKRRNDVDRRQRVTGRVCAYCRRTDSQTGFSSNGSCKRCSRLLCKHPACKTCGGPQKKYKGSELTCLLCKPQGCKPQNAIPVFIHSGLDQRKLWKSKAAWTWIEGKKIYLRHIRAKVGVVRLLVRPDQILLGQSSHSRAALGYTAVPWGPGLALASRPVREQIYELAYYVRRGECCPLTYHRWVEIMCREDFSEKTNRRVWERYKHRLRDLGLDCSPIYKGEGRTRTAVPGIEFSAAEFLRGVEAFRQATEEPEEDE